MVLRRVPPGALRQADREHVQRAVAACRSRRASRSAPGRASCEQGISDEKMDNPIARLTWQMSPRNKFAAYMDRAMRLRGHAMGRLHRSGHGIVRVAHADFRDRFREVDVDGVVEAALRRPASRSTASDTTTCIRTGSISRSQSAAWYAGARKSDNSTGVLWNASSAQLGNYPDRYNVMAAVSYVTGSHNVKIGLQDAWGPYRRWNTANGDLYQIYNGGSPLQVTVLNTPLDRGDTSTRTSGVYVQDSWRLNRFTVNLGLRYDYVAAARDGQPAQTGRFAASVAYDDIYLPTWKGWSPRTSVVYDLFGIGKTAVRVGFNRYRPRGTTGFAQIYNPTALITANITWNDLNRDDIAQGERGCVFLTPGCEINFTQLPRTSACAPSRCSMRISSGPYQLTYNVGIQHELLRGTSVTAEWFHSDFKNLIARNNMARAASTTRRSRSYSPIDGSPITYYNIKRRQAERRPERRQQRSEHEAVVQRRRDQHQRAPAARRADLRRHVDRAHHHQQLQRRRHDPNLLLFCDGSKNNTPVDHLGASWPAATRCRGRGSR